MTLPRQLIRKPPNPWSDHFSLGVSGLVLYVDEVYHPTNFSREYVHNDRFENELSGPKITKLSMTLAAVRKLK